MDKITMFANRLTKVYKHRSKLARKQGVSCYRLYDLDMPDFPFCIDVYEGRVYVAEYKRNHTLSPEEHKDWIRLSKFTISDILGISMNDIYFKERKVIEERQQQYQKLDQAKEEFIVQENGYKFIVNLKDYLDTGLFLDHRITRKMVGEWSSNKALLNLFAYTGSFSVYAAMNNASKIDTVDLSNTYIDWAVRNLKENNIINPSYEFHTADVLDWIKTAPSSTYDLIVCDPPTFSNSKKMSGILDIQRDHVFIINECMRLLKPEGKLIFSTNFTKFKINENDIKASVIKDITRHTTPFDFEGKLERWCYLLS
jgi:23S rRNA (cytosine1962-C5)-methyltransferase